MKSNMYNTLNCNRQQQDEIPVSPELQAEYNFPIYKIIADLKEGKTKKIAIRSEKGQYLTAAEGGGGLIFANKPEVGEFEKFLLVPTGFERDKVAIRTSKGNYFTAVNQGGSSLNAQNTTMGEEQTFQLLPLYPDKGSFMTDKGYFITVEDGGGLVKAYALVVGPTETFVIVPLEE